MAMPNTGTLLSINRPMAATHHLEWETITTYGTGKDGLPQ